MLRFLVVVEHFSPFLCGRFSDVLTHNLDNSNSDTRAEPDETTWPCRRCTFENCEHHSECAMCGEPNPHVRRTSKRLGSKSVGTSVKGNKRSKFDCKETTTTAASATGDKQRTRISNVKLEMSREVCFLPRSCAFVLLFRISSTTYVSFPYSTL